MKFREVATVIIVILMMFFLLVKCAGEGIRDGHFKKSILATPTPQEDLS